MYANRTPHSSDLDRSPCTTAHMNDGCVEESCLTVKAVSSMHQLHAKAADCRIASM